MTPADREKEDGKKKPPFWTRIALIVSAIGVSYSHGANDGQKGIGLIMLVLIGVAPAGFVINMNASGYDITRTRDAVNHLEQYYQQHGDTLQHIVQLAPPALPTPEEAAGAPHEFHCDSARAMMAINRTRAMLNNLSGYDALSVEQRSHLRRLLLCISDTAEKAAKMPEVSAEDKRFLGKLKGDLLNTVEYAPVWIIVAVALALSLGTMVGWRRVATTIGEKIGKKGMTYGGDVRSGDGGRFYRRRQLYRDAGFHDAHLVVIGGWHHAGRRRRRSESHD